MPTHAHTRLPEWRITSWCSWVRKVKREEAREKSKVTVWVRRLNGSELGRKMGVERQRRVVIRVEGSVVPLCGETKQRPAS